eukprot:TRINITY_DN2428_c1_g2_i1.p1 TRINITY_DN2428_c1_g2~~TRINITY_DN2428_c1_g2_i1.p1  ORF type:complete len:364 (-),score=61.49 TRINITY_DN2428_c1_g2_i1:1040-2131(-)
MLTVNKQYSFGVDDFKNKIKITKHDILLITPMIVWLGVFQFAGIIPSDVRPVIDVHTLPFMEGMFFGSSLLYKLVPRNDFLVVFAAIPYVMHFSLPVIYTLWLFKTNKKPFVFLWFFGLLNFFGVMTHMFFPTAPPWYTAKFGQEPANYEIPGDPGRFKRVDMIFDIPIFDTLYGNSPVVFGSFPSLHAGWPFLIAVYTSIMNVPFFNSYSKWAYVFWVWWAALYSKHHFLVDVLGGAVYTIVVIYFSERILQRGFIVKKIPFLTPHCTDMEEEDNLSDSTCSDLSSSNDSNSDVDVYTFGNNEISITISDTNSAAASSFSQCTLKSSASSNNLNKLNSFSSDEDTVLADITPQVLNTPLLVV